jgi:hypothetical protein
MARPRLTRILTLGLGVLYVVVGVAETIQEVSSDEDVMWSWWGTIVGGGVLVLVGAAVTSRHPNVGRGLVCVGSLLGIPVTMRTIVVPLLAVIVVLLTVWEHMTTAHPE